MAGEEQAGPEPGQQERTSYLTVAVVFLVSCGLAAAAVAIHDAGGFAFLLGPRLEDFDPEAELLPVPEPERSPAAPRARELRGPKPGPGARPDAVTKDGVATVDAAAALGNGRLIVRCNRPCRVSVDGTIVGEAAPRLKLKQPAGEHQVRVELLEGEDLATRKVLIAPNRDRELSFTLGGKVPVGSLGKLKGTEDWD